MERESLYFSLAAERNLIKCLLLTLSLARIVDECMLLQQLPVILVDGCRSIPPLLKNSGPGQSGKGASRAERCCLALLEARA
jgi:hypothetical protein